MDDTRVTVYFAGFEFGSTEDEFRDLFSQFGNIEKIFVHKTKTYGMVEFDNNRSCLKAIEKLHQQPPLNLYVNMARNQISNSGSSNNNGNTFASCSKKPQNFNKFNQSNNKQVGDSFIDESITYDIEDYYMDENNDLVTVFTDPITNEIYVPLRYAPSLRKLSRKVPIKMSKLDDERLSIKSDNSERRIKVTKKNDSIGNITIERNLEIDTPPNGRHNNLNHVFRNSFDNKKPFDKSSSNNLFDKSPNKNRNHAQWNGENRVPPAPFNVGSKFSKNSSRPQKHLESTKDNDEDWNSVESTQPINVQLSSVKVESVPAVPVNSKTVVSKPVQASNATKSNEEFALKLKTVDLPNNQFTEVHVENVVNETTVWVTRTDKASELENLTLDICGVIETAPTCVPELGKVVLASFEELWFRAIILSTSPEIRVRYIDYGNEKVVTKADIKEIPPAFVKIPAFALCIKLANGAPCKMVDDILIKVKPVQKENNLIVVHVENGIYEIPAEKVMKVEEEVEEENEEKEKDNHLLNKFHKLLISKINVGTIGFLEMNISLSSTKFIAAFMPFHLCEEAAILQNIKPVANPSFKPVIGDIVCAENEDGWQRVYLLKIENNMFKVAFIDFGCIKHVSEVRPLPKEFINIPIFSCVCSPKNGDDLTQIKESIDFEITNVSGNNISCTIKLNEKKIDVMCIPWDPRKCVPESESESESETSPLPNAPLQKIVLKNGENVKLEMESDGFLYVRNKQASDIRKKIDEFMAVNGSKTAVIAGKPYIGQLITAEFEGDYYRAIITSIKNNDVTICYIDYGNEETLPFFSLKKLHEEMMKEPISIIKIRLRNFINKPFTVKALKYLEDLSDKNIILKATFDESPENGYELKTPNGSSVSEELEKLDGANEFYKTIKIPDDNEKKMFMYDLSLEEIPLGKTEVVFQQFSDIDNNILCVCVNNPEALHKVHVEMKNEICKYVKNMVPNLQYEPEMEECVLVQSEGKWYRGACTSEPEDNEYTIFLVDYGSCSHVSSKNMRRMPKEFAKENALCNFAKIYGIPENANENLRSRLKALLERNNSYPVNVLEKIEDDECYIIQFPTIDQVLKKEKLL